MIGLFIFGVIVIIVSILISIVAEKTTTGGAKNTRVVIRVVGIIIGLVIIGASCIRTVPTGHTGIVTTFGEVESYTYEAGVHVVLPWKEVINMDNRNQKATIDLPCFSSDIQEVDVTYSLNYQIQKENAQEIYKTIGTEYYNTVITPRIQEAVKSVMAKYSAEQLLEKRAELSSEIKTILTAKLDDYNIEVIDTSLENLDFTDSFTNAVEAKQVAAQKKQQAIIEQEQALLEAENEKKIAKTKAEADAEVAKVAANAEADVIRTKADAKEYEGEKDASVIGQARDILAKNKEALTDEDIKNLILYYYVEKWDGKLPETYIGSEDFFKLVTSITGETK